MLRSPKATVRSPLRRWLPMLLMLAVAVASCGDDDDAGPIPGPPMEFAYVLEDFPVLSIYTVDSGMLTRTGELRPPRGTNAPQAFALSPSAAFAFISFTSEAQTMNVTVAYRVDSSDGSLTAVPGEQMTPIGINASVVDPTGRFLYAANGSNAAGGVAAFAINDTSGALSPVTGSPFGDQINTGLAVHPSGRFLYVVNGGDNLLLAYAVNETNGALTPIASPYPIGQIPGSIGIDPTGEFVYVVTSVGVSAFSVNQQAGTLTAVAGSPFAAAAGQSLAVHPDGNFVYVTQSADDMVRGFAIDPSSGALTPVASAVAATGTDPVAITIDAAGRFAYVANLVSRSISIFAIDAASGALTSMGSAATNAPPQVITVRPPE